MVRLAARSGRVSSAIVTDMDEPLAAAIGTGLEAIEARDFLRGEITTSRFARLTHEIASEMLRVGGSVENDIAGQLGRALRSGEAYERFVALVEAQGGTRQALEALAPAQPQVPVAAPAAGFVQAIDAVAIGEAARDAVAAAGSLAGIRIAAPVGTAVRAGEPLAYLAGGIPGQAARVGAAFTLSSAPPAPRALIAAVIRDASLAQPSNPPRNERDEP
jgi:thymidine phosphorylase